MPRRWLDIPDVPLPTSNVDDFPKVSINVNQEWAIALLSLVQHADQTRFWLQPVDPDRVEQNAFTLYQIILKATGMIGVIVPYVGNSAPLGCLPADGSTFLRADYPALYAALPVAYQVDADNFVTPDLGGVFVLGADTSYAPLSTGGLSSVSLTVDQLPSHSHSYSQPTFGVDIESVGVPDPTGVGNPPVGLLTGAAGGNQAHENMPPYIALKYAIVAF